MVNTFRSGIPPGGSCHTGTSTEAANQWRSSAIGWFVVRRGTADPPGAIADVAP
jgi:hypothetical protein